MVGGKMNGVDHFWLTLNDYDDCIVDATIKQFESSENAIFIGKKSQNKITRQYVQKSFSFNEWIDLYKAWSNPRFDSHGYIQRGEDAFRKITINNLVGAAILIYEIEKSEQNIREMMLRSYMCRLYFESIYNGFNNDWKNDIVILRAVKKKVSKEFELLISTLQ